MIPIEMPRYVCISEKVFQVILFLMYTPPSAFFYFFLPSPPYTFFKKNYPTKSEKNGCSELNNQKLVEIE